MEKRINTYLSDLAVLYIKAHNLHWNVTGLAFKQVHEYLEENYDALTEKLDEVAEYLKMQGYYPAASVKEYLELTSINELESRDYTTLEALEILLKDYEKLQFLATEIRQEADEKGDFSLVAMLEDHVADYNKIIWFVRSMLK